MTLTEFFTLAIDTISIAFLCGLYTGLLFTFFVEGRK